MPRSLVQHARLPTAPLITIRFTSWGWRASTPCSSILQARQGAFEHNPTVCLVLWRHVHHAQSYASQWQCVLPPRPALLFIVAAASTAAASASTAAAAAAAAALGRAFARVACLSDFLSHAYSCCLADSSTISRVPKTTVRSDAACLCAFPSCFADQITTSCLTDSSTV